MLDQALAAITRLVVEVMIHDAQVCKQNVGMAHNAFIRLVNRETRVEITHFNFSKDSSTKTVMVFGEVLSLR